MAKPAKPAPMKMPMPMKKGKKCVDDWNGFYPDGDGIALDQGGLTCP